VIAVPQLPIAEPVTLANPRWVRARAPGLLQLAIALTGALSLAAAAKLDLADPRLQLFACPFRALTGVPCFGCGATHAFVQLAHGDLLLAIAANPLWALVAAILWACALLQIARFLGLRWTLALPPLEPLLRRHRMALFALAAANWAFVALRA
jgi:hypothetical protein